MAPPEPTADGGAALPVLTAVLLANPSLPRQNDSPPINSANPPVTTSPSLNRRAS